MRRYISAKEEDLRLWDGMLPDNCRAETGNYTEDCGGMFRWTDLNVWQLGDEMTRDKLRERMYEALEVDTEDRNDGFSLSDYCVTEADLPTVRKALEDEFCIAVSELTLDVTVHDMLDVLEKQL
jgi:hypothetical protein